jgi:hypothetical protein
MNPNYITSGVPDENAASDFNRSIIETGTSVSESPSKITSSRGYEYKLDQTLDVTEKLPERTKDLVGKHGKILVGGLDKSLLKRAQIILESFDCDDAVSVAINIESLRGIILQLWESAANASQFHQDILAVLESAMLSVVSPSSHHLSVFREAIRDLNSDLLAQAHVDVIRRRFISAGFSPLALLTEIDEDGVK